jgi:hypothetical protein
MKIQVSVVVNNSVTSAAYLQLNGFEVQDIAFAWVIAGLATFTGLGFSSPGIFALYFFDPASPETGTTLHSASIVSDWFVCTSQPSGLRIASHPSSVVMEQTAVTCAGKGLARLPTIKIDVIDEIGHLVDAESDVVVGVRLLLSFESGDPALSAQQLHQTLSGSLFARTAAGTATFTDLMIDTPHAATVLLFSAPQLQQAISDPFSVLGPTRLALLLPPSRAVSGRLLGVQPVLGLVDATNSTASFLPAGLRARARIAEGTGAWAGQLLGTVEVGWEEEAGVAGNALRAVARFTDLAILGPYDGYQLTFATDSSCLAWEIEPVTSPTFEVAVAAATTT